MMRHGRCLGVQRPGEALEQITLLDWYCQRFADAGRAELIADWIASSMPSRPACPSAIW